MTKKELKEINRREEDVLRAGIEWMAISLLGAAAVGILLMAGKASAETAEAQAAQVIQKNCTVRQETLYVPPVPAEAPTEGELPEAIDIVQESEKDARTETGLAEEWVSLGTFRTTGFCNCRKCCGKWAGGKTASGTWPMEGRTIAVDKRVIPMGTEVMIDGNVYRAEDTGSGIYGNRIDIYYEDHSRAWNHGVQYKEVFVRK